MAVSRNPTADISDVKHEPSRSTSLTRWGMYLIGAFAVSLVALMQYVSVTGADPVADLMLLHGYARDMLSGAESFALTGQGATSFPLSLTMLGAALAAVPASGVGVLWLAVFALPSSFGILYFLRQANPSTTWGMWVFLTYIVLAWPYFLVRFEPVPAFLLTAGLVLATQHRMYRAAALILLAALVKVIPGFALVALRRPERPHPRWQTVLLAALTVVAFADVARTALVTAGRHMQVEAVSMLPFMFLHALGKDGDRTVTYASAYPDGAEVIYGPWVTTVGRGVLLLGVIGIVAVAARLGYVYAQLHSFGPWWHRVWRGSELSDGQAPLATALAVFSVLLLTATVFSPQYLVYPLVVVAVAGQFGWLRGGGGLLLAATGLSTLVYPILYEQFVAGAIAPTALLAVRAALLVALLIYAVRRIQPVARVVQNDAYMGV